MNVGNYVVVINKNCNLYRRRCRIVKIIVENDLTIVEVYSEGMEESETVLASECEISKF